MKINFRKTQFWGVAADIASCPTSDRPEVVLAGKSNVGKSALLNALADNKKLARVSQSPGKTRLVVYFDVDEKIYIADLPGYGYAKAPKNIKEQFSKLVDQYFASDRTITLVLHLIDFRHQATTEDRVMIEYMNEANIPYFIVFTKGDKFSKVASNKQLQLQMKDPIFDSAKGVFLISSEKKLGLEELRQGIDDFVF